MYVSALESDAIRIGQAKCRNGNKGWKVEKTLGLIPGGGSIMGGASLQGRVQDEHGKGRSVARAHLG